jgi:hypothetical protein
MATRIDVVWSGLGGSPYFSSFFFDGAVDTTTVQTEADKLHDLLHALEGGMVNDLTWSTSGTATNFNPATGSPTSTTGFTPDSGVGEDTGDGLPRATQGLAQLRTGTFVNGREIRGRMFIPGPAEANNDSDGTPSSAYISGAAASFQDLIDWGVNWSVWSRTAGDLYEITSVGIWPEWAVLRSRRD